MAVPAGHQVFRLQIVNADDDVVVRFAGGGRVERDLIDALASSLRAAWLPPQPSFVRTFAERLRSFLGFTTRSQAERAALSAYGAPTLTDAQIVAAVAETIAAFKQNSVALMRERYAADR